jgi:hypothetical protein
MPLRPKTPCEQFGGVIGIAGGTKAFSGRLLRQRVREPRRSAARQIQTAQRTPQEVPMRKLMLAAGLMLLGATAAQADPYKWCAQYSGRSGGGTNCYFMTIQQCQAAISGIGGFCRRNNFYDGRAQRTPEETSGIGQRRYRDDWNRW